MNKKIEALKKATNRKAEEALSRVKKALERMIRERQTINFQTVATAANVSTAYLYKIPELKERITTLREQQQQQPKQKRPPAASENSKNRIIQTLREQNAKLKKEIQEVTKENDALAGRLYQLQEYYDISQRLKGQNQSLTEQVKKLQEQLADCQSKLPQKVGSIGEAKKTTAISERIKKELKVAGVTLNQTLTRIIKATDEQTVLDAISALIEAMASENIKRPGGWLKKAIEEGRKPKSSVAINKSEKDTFND